MRAIKLIAFLRVVEGLVNDIVLKLKKKFWKIMAKMY